MLFIHEGFPWFSHKSSCEAFCLLVNARLWSLTCWWLVWVRHVCFAAHLFVLAGACFAAVHKPHPLPFYAYAKLAHVSAYLLAFRDILCLPIQTHPDPLMKSACCLHGFRWVSLPWCYPDFWCYPWQPLLYQGLRAPTRCMGEHHGIVVLLSHL